MLQLHTCSRRRLWELRDSFFRPNESLNCLFKLAVLIMMRIGFQSFTTQYLQIYHKPSTFFWEPYSNNILVNLFVGCYPGISIPDCFKLHLGRVSQNFMSNRVPGPFSIPFFWEPNEPQCWTLPVSVLRLRTLIRSSGATWWWSRTTTTTSSKFLFSRKIIKLIQSKRIRVHCLLYY